LLSERRDDDAPDTERDTTDSGTEADADADDPPITACPPVVFIVVVVGTGVLTPNNPGAT
jgi:hypothetical protein